MLTPVMKRALEFIVSYTDERNGISPTYREIAAHLKCNVSRAHGLVVALEKRGFIRRLQHCARGIETLQKSAVKSPPRDPTPKMHMAMIIAMDAGDSVMEIWRAGFDAAIERRAVE